MTEPLLAPGVPGQVAARYESGELHWTTGWGNYDDKTCPHGALLRPCAIPGDEIMWSALLTYRGLSMAWNDQQTSVIPVIDRLNHQAEPDEAEMTRAFGSNWEAGRAICRTYGSATPEQRRALGAARAAWAAWEAWEARAAWAAWAAWEARAARAAWEARAAWAAWEAWEAFCATIAEPWIVEGTSWDRAAHDVLMGPWWSVFGQP